MIDFKQHPTELELLRYFQFDAGKGPEVVRSHVYDCRKCQNYLMGHNTVSAKDRLKIVESYSKDGRPRSPRQRAGIQKLFNK